MSLEQVLVADRQSLNGDYRRALRKRCVTRLG